MTTTWHADDETLARYAADELDDARAYSLEAHLIACEVCRAGLTEVTDVARLDAMWAAVVDSIDAPRRGVVERGLVRLRVPGHIARLLAATPSLQLSWFLAEAVALGFAVFAADQATGRREDVALVLFLVVAALLPVAGVAVAYGPRVDPTYEVGLAAPMRSSRLLLIRAAAVLGTSIAITGLSALALPGSDWTAAAWLLPSLGLTLATLALATWVRPLVAAFAVTLAWLVGATVAVASPTDPLVPFRSGGQIVFLLIIVASAFVLLRRREALEGGVAA
jgi:hypothetical protein